MSLRCFSGIQSFLVLYTRFRLQDIFKADRGYNQGIFIVIPWRSEGVHFPSPWQIYLPCQVPSFCVRSLLSPTHQTSQVPLLWNPRLSSFSHFLLYSSESSPSEPRNGFVVWNQAPADKSYSPLPGTLLRGLSSLKTAPSEQISLFLHKILHISQVSTQEHPENPQTKKKITRGSQYSGANNNSEVKADQPCPPKISPGTTGDQPSLKFGTG